MAYKSLLTVLSDDRLAETPLSQSIAMADQMDAHLDALCLGVDRSQTGYYLAGANAMVLQDIITRAYSEADALEKQVIATLERSGVRWGSETAVSALPDLGRHVAHHARFCDLVMLCQPYGADRGPEHEPIVEAAMFDGKAPVLVLPDDHAAKAKPKRILLAWNESTEALNAIRRALPFLQAAEQVRVVVIDPPRHGPERSDPGGSLSQMLSRHGVHCEIDVLNKSLSRVSDVLLRHVTDTDSDLVVMGAYGHSRFREAILGGATRNMLEHATVPVFMAH